METQLASRDSEIQLQIADLGMKLTDARAHLTEMCNTLNAENATDTFQELLHVQYDHFTTAWNILDDKCESREAAQNDRIVSMRDHFTSTCSKFELALETKLSAKDSRVEELFELMHAQRAFFIDTCGKLDHKLSTAVASQCERLESQYLRLKKISSEADTRIAALSESFTGATFQQATVAQKDRDALALLLNQVCTNCLIEHLKVNF